MSHGEANDLRRSTQRWLIAIAMLGIVIAALVRGERLLGLGAGIAYALVAVGTLFVVWRVFATKRRFQLARQIVALLFAVGVFTILAFPAYFNPRVQCCIDAHQTQRVTQAQLQEVLASDPRFSGLRYQCDYKKCIIVSVNGSIKTKRDLSDFRDRIFKNCPHVSSQCLRWNIAVEESGVTYNRCDSAIFAAILDNHNA